MSIVPKSWMPKAKMLRIITHWTAGGYKAGGIDYAHYHILIDGNSDVLQGSRSIKDNEDTVGKYAAHTSKLNSGSIGVAVCCMAKADETTKNYGAAPMKEAQWKRMAEVVAVLCKEYGIAVTDKTVLGHGEVQDKLGVKQNGKWDPLVFPWDKSVSKKKAGDLFRDLVKVELAKL